MSQGVGTEAQGDVLVLVELTSPTHLPVYPWGGAQGRSSRLL